MVQLLTKLADILLNHSWITLGIFKQSLRTKPIAWRNLGFTRGNPKTKFSNADKERGKQNVHKFSQKDPRHVPDNHRDFHCTNDDIVTRTLANPRS